MLNKSQSIFVVAVLSTLGLANYAHLSHAERICEPFVACEKDLDVDLRDPKTGLPLTDNRFADYQFDSATYLSLPPEIKGFPPVLKLIPAASVRRAHEAYAQAPDTTDANGNESKPLPYKYGGPLPPNTMHLWPKVTGVAPWPTE